MQETFANNYMSLKFSGPWQTELNCFSLTHQLLTEHNFFRSKKKEADFKNNYKHFIFVGIILEAILHQEASC